MVRRQHEGFGVIGLSARVSNDEPSGIAALWSQFYQSDLRQRIPEAAGSCVCVYHGYEGDHSAPFSMTIGYRVPDCAACPEGLSLVSIPPQTFAVFEAVGTQPEALISQSQAIWLSDLDRAFVADFDTYDAKNQDFVTVNVGIKIKPQ